jgi:hypothetical protein
MAKPRILISTDLGGADADDIQSMVHALLYADQFKLEGIVSSPTKHDGRTSDIHKVIDAYAKDYAKLKTWSSDYPSPEYLHSIVKQGNVNVAPEKGWSSPTAGSKAIIQAAHESSQPLWVLTWGGMTDLAQALHDDPSIAGKIKVYSSNGWNGTQDPHSREYIYNNFKNVWWVESKSTHRGIWVGDSGTEDNNWRMGDADGHGALGEYFQNARPWGLKMGDTPSFLFALKNVSDPSSGGWGGSFVKKGANFWSDNPNPSLKIGPYNGADTIQRYQDAIYKDFALHFDRAKASKSGVPSKPAEPSKPTSPTNQDDPVVASNDSANTRVDKAVKIAVLANDKAADGGLKLASVDATTAEGGKVVMNSDGTLSYTPKKGYVGTDSFGYASKDADGDTDKASVSVKVAGATKPPSNGNGPTNGNDPVAAKDDAYKVDAGKALSFNPHHLLKNDEGKDGGLKIASIQKVGDAGGTLTWDGKGLATYKAKAGFTGTDYLDYVLKDKDGSSDTGTIKITVAKAGSSSKPDAKPDPKPTPGTKDLVADNVREVDPGGKHYFNSKYLTWNGKGPSKDLKVVALDKSSEEGRKVGWEKNGTVIYEAKKGWHGVDKLDFTVADKQGHRDTATVFLEVGKADARAEVAAAKTAAAQDWPSESLSVRAAVHQADPADHTVHPDQLLS